MSGDCLGHEAVGQHHPAPSTASSHKGTMELADGSGQSGCRNAQLRLRTSAQGKRSGQADPANGLEIKCFDVLHCLVKKVFLHV